MQYNKLPLEEKCKLLTLMSEKYIQLDFSKLNYVMECNYANPRWMDTYILIFKSGLKPDIKAYDIMLKKLSLPIMRLLFKDGEKTYVATANQTTVDLYLWFLITGEATSFPLKVQYVPKREYIKEILKFNKFQSAGIFLKNLEDDRFRITPTDFEFEEIEDATIYYNQFLDAYDVFRGLKLSINNFLSHIHTAMELGKDKRLLATISNILSYFDLQFEIQDDAIALKDSSYRITNEKEADRFQVKLIDAYQFFRNVINAEDKKDIVSEVYNRKLSATIRNQFESHVLEYMQVLKNQELVDWMITISKESKYTLPITFDEEGVFYIEDTTISNVAEAKAYYIDYMDQKKEKLAMTIYKNNILSRIKSAWNKFKAKFAKT